MSTSHQHDRREPNSKAEEVESLGENQRICDSWIDDYSGSNDASEGNEEEDEFIWSSDKSTEDDRQYPLIPLDASRLIYCFERSRFDGLMDVTVKEVQEPILAKITRMQKRATLLGMGVQGSAYLIKNSTGRDPRSSGFGSSGTESSFVIKTISLSPQEWIRAKNKQCMIQRVHNHVNFLMMDFWLREMCISSMAHQLVISQKSPHLLKYHWFATGEFPSLAHVSDSTETRPQAMIAMEKASGTSIELLNWSKNEPTLTEWQTKIRFGDIHRFSVFAFQTLQGLAAVQCKYKVMHRDLHMANVFIQKAGEGYNGNVFNKTSWVDYHFDIPTRTNSGTIAWKSHVYSLPNEGYSIKIADWGLAVSYASQSIISTKKKIGAYDPMYDVLKIMSSWYRSKKYLARVFLMSDIEDVLYDLVQSFLTVIDYNVNREVFTAKRMSERTRVLSYFFDGIPDTHATNASPEPLSATSTIPVLKNEHAIVVKSKNVGWELPQKEKTSTRTLAQYHFPDVFKRHHYFYQPDERLKDGKARLHYFPRCHALQAGNNNAVNIITNATCFNNWTIPRQGARVASLTRFDYQL
uniref:Serine/threonine kinase n=1 Tax=Clandestinovirus TaxID=2831644 RepID=A0A8F8KKZ1_9VIRU|nr:serine/threonine kinase [Clandestinovirus]